MKIEVQLNHYDLRILIDDLPHVYILRKEFVGFHSWADDNSMWCIEYITIKNKIKTEFDTIDKWKKILTALNEKL